GFAYLRGSEEDQAAWDEECAAATRREIGRSPTSSRGYSRSRSGSENPLGASVCCAITRLEHGGGPAPRLPEPTQGLAALLLRSERFNADHKRRSHGHRLTALEVLRESIRAGVVTPSCCCERPVPAASSNAPAPPLK